MRALGSYRVRRVYYFSRFVVFYRRRRRSRRLCRIQREREHTSSPFYETVPIARRTDRRARARAFLFYCVGWGSCLLAAAKTDQKLAIDRVGVLCKQASERPQCLPSGQTHTDRFVFFCCSRCCCRGRLVVSCCTLLVN